MTKYWLAFVASVMLGSISQMFLKKSTLIEHKNHIQEYLNIWVITGYSLLVLSTLLVIYGYQALEYKNGAVMNSLGYLFVMILSYFIYKEPIKKSKVLGVALIIVGVIIFYI